MGLFGAFKFGRRKKYKAGERSAGLERGRVRELQAASALQDDFLLTAINNGMEPSWLNALLDNFWPFIADYIEKMLREDILPIIQQIEPVDVLSRFDFTDISMGTLGLPRCTVSQRINQKTTRNDAPKF